MTHINVAASAEVALSSCAGDADIRVLHRVSSLNDFPLAEPGDGPIRTVAVIDTETTGTDPDRDEIIDIAVVIIAVDADGQIVRIDRAGQALRDPGMPIPAAITKLTGITDADVRGKIINLDALEKLIASADVRIAHNAPFDVAFVERLLPGLAGGAWACSARDFDWLEHGFDGAKLGHLLMQIGRFNTGHRAMADVISLLHLLAHRLADGSTVIGEILAKAERPTVRIEATGAPFDKRSVLKSRGYRWDPTAKAWWIEIPADDLESEALWLQREVTPWGPTPHARRLTWHERHR
ncbi:3'-5' exonuclease [Sphingomonas sp. 2R-10]|uniref:3'-5' exonuclease n=1 Tax=Sphingomonas sp. 2R-10 TaxID=3045148 RepID=UPI000F7B7AD6|nr:3'-5' exonuclease [Sphingomonas sp. 2R-10]MDJ0278816.1 3'-5' exonuclease [Sphingomonas sp. 2R-10]